MTKNDWGFINNLEDPNLEEKFNQLTKKYVEKAFDKNPGEISYRKLYLLQDKMLQDNWMAKLTLSETNPDKQLMARFKTAFYLLDNTGMVDDYYSIFGRTEEQEKKFYTLLATIMKKQMDNNKTKDNALPSLLAKVTNAICGKHFVSRLLNKNIHKGENNYGEKYDER